MSADEIQEIKRTLDELDRDAAETDAASEALKREADEARQKASVLMQEAERVRRRLEAAAV
jgi:hypothetical protein